MTGLPAAVRSTTHSTERTTWHLGLPTEDEPLAEADVSATPTAVQMSFTVASGHLPSDIRAQLVAAVFELPALKRLGPVQASVPLGDVDLINEVGARCQHVRSRAAGVTCLIDAEVAPGR